MSVPAMSVRPADDHTSGGRAARLDRCLAELLGQAPELEAAAVVSFDGLAMASALPAGMDEDRVAAMSAALLSLGEKAAQGLGRGDLSQVYVEGEHGTVFLVSAQDEAVLVAVAAKRAKVGLMLYEVRRAARAGGAVLQEDDLVEDAAALAAAAVAPAPPPVPAAPVSSPAVNGHAQVHTGTNGAPEPVTSPPHGVWSPYSPTVTPAAS